MRFDEAFGRRPLIAILRGVRRDEAAAIATAIVDAGFLLVEVPLNSPDPFSSIAAVAEAVGARAAVGAGTVYDEAGLMATRAAGGCFAVAPHCDSELIGAAVALGMACCPGAMTPSEVLTAARAGAAAVKVFPSEVVGPRGLAAMRGVIPREVPLVPVGGVDGGNLADYRAAGADGAGFGSSLYRPGRSAAEAGERAAALVERWDAAS